MRKVQVSIGARPGVIESVAPPKVFQAIKDNHLEEAYCLLFFDDDGAVTGRHLCALASSLKTLRELTEAWLLGATLQEMEVLMKKAADDYENEQSE